MSESRSPMPGVLGSEGGSGRADSGGWTPNPPWGPQHGDMDGERVCVRCEVPIAPHHRHFWAPCRPCAIWSFLGTQLLRVLMGHDGAREWMYWGWRPDCSTCDGEGYMPCEDQDLSIMRQSGTCQECGAYAYKLVRWVEPYGDVEGSGRHYDDVAAHEVLVGPMPLVSAVDTYLDRNVRPPEVEELQR